jgi:glycerol kinase
MILAIDQGTTGTTCIVFDEQGRPRGRAYSEFEQHFPRPGWVEHDAEEVRKMWREAARYEPRMGEAERQELLGRWREALARSRGWSKRA